MMIRHTKLVVAGTVVVLLMACSAPSGGDRKPSAAPAAQPPPACRPELRLRWLRQLRLPPPAHPTPPQRRPPIGASSCTLASADAARRWPARRTASRLARPLRPNPRPRRNRAIGRSRSRPARRFQSISGRPWPRTRATSRIASRAALRQPVVGPRRRSAAGRDGAHRPRHGGGAFGESQGESARGVPVHVARPAGRCGPNVDPHLVDRSCRRPPTKKQDAAKIGGGAAGGAVIGAILGGGGGAAKGAAIGGAGGTGVVLATRGKEVQRAGRHEPDRQAPDADHGQGPPMIPVQSVSVRRSC